MNLLSGARAVRRPAFPARDVLRVELLAGLVVALALIPEAISFSLIAGVDPKVGLYASFTMAVTIAIAGGRPAMISAATGAMALVVVSLVKDHGVEYLLVAGILAGVIQVGLGVLRVPRLMRFVPRSVMTGFVNALAILIFIAQVPYIRDGGLVGVGLILAGLAVIYTLPRTVPSIPAPLVAIALLTVVVVAGGIHVPNVGDEGELPSALPILGIPSVPFTLQTLTIVLPYSITLAAVGLLESLMTARLVDDITETRSDKDREARGQGIANIVTGFFGGMPGCAMIGQTMINVSVSGARTRISTFCAGLFLLILIVGLGPVVAVIPMAALVAVMILVSVSTFDWHSIKPATLKRMPRSETLIMAVTVAGTVATSNLAIGVAAGVLTAMATFARKVAHLVDVQRVLDPDGSTAFYSVTGELFFASDQELIDAFDYPDDPARVIIDFSGAHVWDASAVAALDAIETHYARYGTDVQITGLNDHSADLHQTLSGQMAAAH
ncbi:SulP family inorganic anion transporter [Paraconexibacter antarcticus]|uniref:SulP family inorganic anion transporter n=1 Tax=Paraconexibacter antarcticus TaxID=2949664 RepID=A0ABY5DRL3_9ACTN|nr:SulP family inorganic anion transporter [Paraconexibacter antarcticus]UTI63387.1 SulP family inorganic anion transporter [Paraconexibacter antarcticus]